MPCAIGGESLPVLSPHVPRRERMHRQVTTFRPIDVPSPNGAARDA